MTDLEYLIRENTRLKRENAKLMESNALLSRLFFLASKKLKSYQVPVRYVEPEGKLQFIRKGDTVVITFTEETISETGDPVLDEILRRK